MANLTVSSAVDTFMQASDTDDMQTACGLPPGAGAASNVSGIRIDATDGTNTIYSATGGIGVSGSGDMALATGSGKVTLDATSRLVVLDTTGGDDSSGCFHPGTDAATDNTRVWLGNSTYRFAGAFIDGPISGGSGQDQINFNAGVASVFAVSDSANLSISRVVSVAQSSQSLSFSAGQQQGVSITMTGVVQGDAIAVSFSTTLPTSIAGGVVLQCIWNAGSGSIIVVLLNTDQANGNSWSGVIYVNALR